MGGEESLLVSAEQSSLSINNLAGLAVERAEAPLWIDNDGIRTWREFGLAVEAARQAFLNAGVLPGEVVITPAEAEVASLSWLFGAGAAGAVVAPLRAERFAEVASWKTYLKIDWKVQCGVIIRVGEGATSVVAAGLLDELNRRGHPGLILATGGTTGMPKLVLHDLNALLATVPIRVSQARRILPLMRFDHIGGLDMAWRALGAAQILVSPPVELNAEAVAISIERHRVEVLPATPSFLNLFLLSEVARSRDLSSLKVVPYGAEPMPDGLLMRLKATFPKAEFVQRFGTSETGTLPVRDCAGGLMLRQNQRDFDWKIVEGELWIRSPSRALGYLSGKSDCFQADGWYRTGDLAQASPEGAVRVLGRKQELINVGGEKVLPSEVEGALLSHPLVADCRVGPQPNAVLGQTVAAEIVWRGPDRDPVVVKRILRDFALGLLARHKIPSVVRLVETLDSTRNFKKARTIIA